MNKKIVSIIKNISYTISSNLITLIISTVFIMIIPKFLNTEEYGYWHLYLFYATYVGLFHFGWNDGIYLRYGGKLYKDLEKKLFFSQFVMLFSSQFVIGAIIWLYSYLFISDVNKNFIIIMVSVSMIIVNTRVMLLYILQATNRIKEYARITISDRIVFILLVIILIFIGVRDYKQIIYADVVGKLFSLIYSIISCREIVLNKINNFYLTIHEAVINIYVGIKLMVANIASMLIIGIVRLGIERTWDISTFGKVSLTLSISNLMMLFINAIGVIMFPVLRRTNENKLPTIYITMKTLLMVPLLGLLVLYYPLKWILMVWLPQYSESLNFMALLFPMCVYEGKMALLINTYLKTLRKEKLILKINLISVIISFIMTLFLTSVFENLTLSILLIVFLLAFRSSLAEIILSKILNVSVSKDILLEIVITTIFILSSWFLTSWSSTLVYLVSYALYLVIKKRDIKNMLNNIKVLIRG